MDWAGLLDNEPKDVLFVGLFLSALSIAFAYVILKALSEPEPLFAQPMYFLLFYLIIVGWSGFFYYRRLWSFLFYGCIFHGGLTVVPFVIAYYLFLSSNINLFFSVFAAPLFHIVLTLYQVNNATHAERRRWEHFIYVAFIFMAALLATFGLIIILDTLASNFQSWSDFILSFSPVQRLLVQLLLASIVIFASSYFYTSPSRMYSQSKHKTSYRIYSGIMGVISLVLIFMGALLSYVAFVSFLTGVEFYDWVADARVVYGIFAMSVIGTGVGFVELIIGTLSLGYYSPGKERRSVFLLRNALFVVVVTVQFLFFFFKQFADALYIQLVQAASFALLAYEFFNALERNSDFYQSISERITVPTPITRLTQAIVIAFTSFLLEVVNVYTYCLLLPFWAIAISNSFASERIPRFMRGLVTFGEKAGEVRRFEELQDKKLKMSSSAEASIYSACITGVVVPVLLWIYKVTVFSLIVFWAIWLSAIPLFLVFRWAIISMKSD